MGVNVKRVKEMDLPTAFDHFAVLKPDLLLDQLPVGPRIYEELDKRYDNFRSHVLISAHQFSGDWDTWEKHPAGDEMVVLLSGRAELLLRTGAGDESTILSQPGEYVAVPRNTWHTARISEPTRMLFITPGEGTAHEHLPEAGK